VLVAQLLAGRERECTSLGNAKYDARTLSAAIDELPACCAQPPLFVDLELTVKSYTILLIPKQHRSVPLAYQRKRGEEIYPLSANLNPV
jgi:hypothetical protein